MTLISQNNVARTSSSSLLLVTNRLWYWLAFTLIVLLCKKLAWCKQAFITTHNKVTANSLLIKWLIHESTAASTDNCHISSIVCIIRHSKKKQGSFLQTILYVYIAKVPYNGTNARLFKQLLITRACVVRR